MLFFSIIIPVFNRPEEIRELLQSLTQQTYKNFEVLVVEDGSKPEFRCEEIVQTFENQLVIKYFFKENTGQGFTRNYAFERAKGDFFIIFDSDIIVPADYLQIVNQATTTQHLDAFGGPDAASPDFNAVQKAISYSMTSIFTTGGIRGKKSGIGTFHPRSFNMGLSKKVYESVGGFIITRMAEDLEFSIRIIRAGFKVALVEEAFVYHKRRSTFGQFFKQLHFFGRARINLSRFYPEELKLVHFFPLAFTLFCLFLPMVFFVSKLLFVTGLLLLLLYVSMIFTDATLIYKSISIGFLGVAATFVQLLGYGFGFMKEGWKKLFEKN
ncbi:MAG: glycosyltransferase [Verrucomicrobia bacterium]|nr:glycosyltransferase [Cytophagales bacterium]